MNFNITLWSLFLLLGSFQALFLFLLFIFNRQHANRKSQFIFSILMLIFSIILFDHSLRLSELYKAFPYGLYTSDALWYLLAPLLWLYFKTRVGNHTFKWWDILHFIPYFLFLYIYRGVLLAPPNVKVLVLESYYAAGSVYSTPVKLFILLMMIQMLAYLLASFKLLHSYEQQFKQYFSSNEVTYLIVLKRILVVFLIYFLFEFSYSSYRNYMNIPNKFIENWSLVMWTLFLIILAYVIIKNPKYIFSAILLKKQHSNDTDITLAKTSLLNYMQSDLPFLKSELTLDELAQSINMNGNQLSLLLNNYMNTSFYEFVNVYRAKYVAQQLSKGEYKKLSIWGIAEASGFKSKASFYAYFKKEFNITPKKYIEQMESN